MTPLDFFSFAGGTLALLLTLHLSVFWLSRFLYPPQKPMVVVAPPPPALVVPTMPHIAVVSQPPLPEDICRPPVLRRKCFKGTSTSGQQ